MTRSTKQKLVYYIAVGLALATFLFLASRHITLPGLNHDEVLQAPPAIYLIKERVNAGACSNWSVTIAGRAIPLMCNEYLGAAKSFMLIPSFYLFGISVPVFRLTLITVALLGVIFTARFAHKAYRPIAALGAVWLLVTDPSFLLYARTDFGPVSLAFGLRMASLFYLMKWWKGGGRRCPLLLASAMLGLGVYDKANFLWFIFALVPVAASAWLLSRKRPPLVVKDFALALFVGLLAGLPFWIYNFTENWATFHSLSPSEGGLTLSQLIEVVPKRTQDLLRLFNGYELGYRMFGVPLSKHLGISGTLLFPLTLLAILCLVIRSFVAREWRLLALPIIMFLILAQIYSTPRRGVLGHHWISIYPLPHLMIGVALGVVWHATEPWRKARTLVRAISIAPILLALGINLLVVQDHYRMMLKTGGVGAWSDAVYQVADLINRRYPDRQIQIMDWGLANPLFLLSEGQLKLHEPYWGYLFKPESRAGLVDLIADQSNVFLLNVSHVTITKEPRAMLEQAAERAGMIVKTDVQFSDRLGRPAYALVEYAPRPASP
jgi:hypothetical protein